MRGRIRADPVERPGKGLKRRRIATDTRIPPPLLDDMLWELGRDDPDLLGHEAGDLHEPGRDPSSPWY